jgi:transcriptional regulator with XRE-family HTH domain
MGRLATVPSQRNKITGGQIRAARALLNLSAQELADLTTLSRGTIQRAELETADTTAANGARITEALEKLGVIFLPADTEGPGIRLRGSQKK